MSFERLDPEHQLLLDVCQNALIALYLQVGEKKGFTPVPARNAIIKKFIKPKIKLPAFKLVKKELKQLSVASANVQLESQLHKLISTMTRTCLNQDIIFDYLGDLHVSTGLMVSVVEKDTVAAPGHIYVLGEELVGNVTDQGELSGPIGLYVYTSTSCTLEKLLAVANTSLFSAEIVEQHDDHAHIEVTLKQ